MNAQASTPAGWGTERQSPFGVRFLAGPTAVLADLEPRAVLDLIAVEHLLILRGLPASLSVEEFEAFGCGLGEPILWSDRPAFDVQAHPEPEDHLFESGFMPMHFDGIYSDDHTPDLQIFHCVQAVDPALGGATLFCDTTLVLADAAPETRALWGDLIVHYERPIAGHTVTRDLPLITRHPHHGHHTIRYSEPVPAGVTIINPPRVTLPDGHHAETITADLHEAIHDPRHLYTHHWQPGDIAIADNRTLLHTRQPYPADAPRLLRRITTRHTAKPHPNRPRGQGHAAVPPEKYRSPLQDGQASTRTAPSG
ncbi:TauD/TfdA family dioxygenase [Actinomadura oligospora]|uniref:TauD/TfdA family dioxygenase n=1 Tax=Actinomadura oligospora TaxID=111804 RepID=UPI0004AD3D40|nr:TauD/TfdA family dioxygenase [Actinomadura oligospora]